MNGFILVFGMVLVLAAERRFAADRAAAGRPPPAADSPAPWRGAHPQPTAPPVARYPSAAGNPPARGRRQSRGRVPGRSRRPSTMIGRVCGSAPDARRCTYDSAPRARRRRGCGMARNEHAVLSRSCGRLHWQDIAVMHSRVANCGNIPPRCVFGGPVVARLCRGAFPGGDPWQLFRFMRSRRGLGREKHQFAARYRRHASETSRLWQDIRAMHPKSAANSRLRIHRAKISPGRGPFRCAGPSDHARRADLAVVRRSPGAGPYAWKVGAGSRNRTPHCCRRSRVPARHLVAFCGGSLSRSKRLALRHAALAVAIPRRDRPAPWPPAPPPAQRMTAADGFAPWPPAPHSFGRQRLSVTQRTKNGQHFAGRFCEVMS